VSLSSPTAKPPYVLLCPKVFTVTAALSEGNDFHPPLCLFPRGGHPCVPLQRLGQKPPQPCDGEGTRQRGEGPCSAQQLVQLRVPRCSQDQRQGCEGVHSPGDRGLSVPAAAELGSGRGRLHRGSVGVGVRCCSSEPSAAPLQGSPSACLMLMS